MKQGRVAVIGITGRVGSRIAKELLSRGIEIIGINRRPERIPVRCDFTCPTAKADAGNYEEILAAIQGAETVVMATEPTREHPENYPTDHATVLRACKAAGVKRFVTVLNYYALQAPDGRPMLEADPVHPAFYPVESAYVKAAQVLEGETELDWCAIAAPAELVPYAGKTGHYRTQPRVLLTTDDSCTAFKEVSRLSMEDMADCVANQVEHPQWHRQIISVAY